MTSTSPAPAGIPGTSLAFSVAGLGPVILLTIGLFLIADGVLRGFVAHGLVCYGAIILSFLGGVRYGACIRAGDASASRLALAIAVLPALIGWLLVIARTDVALLGLAIVHLLLVGVDALGRRPNLLPDWYRAQRPWLGLTVAATLLIAYLVLIR